MKVLKNPFEERIEQIINIGTGDCASKDVVMSLRSIESVGQNQYKRYVHWRLCVKRCCNVFALYRKCRAESVQEVCDRSA